MDKNLFFPGYERYSSTTSSPSRKGKVKKERKTFSLNMTELFHSDLYGEMPQSFTTPLPALEPYHGEIPTRLAPFNEAYAYKYYNCTVHFFINGLLFIRVLRNPEKYLEFFKKCHSVIGTDLSQYAKLVQIYLSMQICLLKKDIYVPISIVHSLLTFKEMVLG